MRLKSLKLRRAEAADKVLDDQQRGQPRGGEPPASRDSRSGPAGRVRHDERGMAIWDWAAASGDTAALSASSVMRKLDVSALSIEQTQRSLKAMELPARDAGGGSDPYNQHRDQRDPFKPAAASANDPYNSGNLGAAPARRPPPKAPVPAPAKNPGSSVLDQLTGKKK